MRLLAVEFDEALKPRQHKRGAERAEASVFFMALTASA
jgi:hypothetical protein